MDLVSAITGFNNASVMAEVQIRVARKMLDIQQLQGNAAIKLIQAASQTTNQAGDELVAAATGLGGQMDVYG